jgi:carboxypeptidase Taq
MDTQPTSSPAPITDDAAASAELAGLREYVTESTNLRFTMALLGWDEQTKLPRGGVESRAAQKATIAALLHERATSDELDRRIAAVEDADPGNAEARVCRREYEQSTRLPESFVRELVMATSLGRAAWEHAREHDDFASFAPHLEKLVGLAQRQAELLGFETEAWDALHDLYEQGSTAAMCQRVFDGLRAPTLELLDQVPPADLDLLRQPCDLAEQERFGRWLVEQVGFDITRGRIDPTAHPFCTTTGVGDVRLTTRYDERWMTGSLFATLHEGGHGIYEQAFHRLGLPLTLADAPGLGMHESQSRMYENVIGRSLPFWQHYYGDLQKAFPKQFGDVPVEEFVRAINAAERSLIRVVADELTYNLHIGLRFELERGLVNGDLAVADLPEAWNDGMERWVGVRPANDAEGVLQDVHWSHGSFGYFPTYTLGNVYAAQFVEEARKDLDFDALLGRGDVLSIREWFDEKVYRHGSAKTGIEFVRDITGGGDVDPAPLVRYLQGKYGQ